MTGYDWQAQRNRHLDKKKFAPSAISTQFSAQINACLGISAHVYGGEMVVSRADAHTLFSLRE